MLKLLPIYDLSVKGKWTQQSTFIDLDYIISLGVCSQSCGYQAYWWVGPVEYSQPKEGSVLLSSTF